MSSRSALRSRIRRWEAALLCGLVVASTGTLDVTTSAATAAAPQAASPSAAAVAATVQPAPGGPHATTRSAAAADYTPGRVQQLSGESGYAMNVPAGTTLQTTVTAPTLSCSQIPPAFQNEQVGVQNSLEIGGEYVVEQSWCVNNQQHNQINIDISTQPYDPVGLGVTGPVTLTETIASTSITGSITQASNNNMNWTVPGTFTTASSFIGMLDNTTYTSQGGIVPYTQIPFSSTTVNGEGLGAWLEGTPGNGGVEQNSVFGSTLQDQSSFIGGGSDFTIKNANATLPGISAGDASTPMPASGTTTVNVPVDLAASSSEPVYIDFTTSNGSAVAGTNYDATSGTLLYNPGQTIGEVPVTTLAGEGGPDLTFSLDLSNPSYTVVAGDGTVTVSTVDVASVDPASGLPEGGNTVTITGHGFTGADSVRFTPQGGTPVDAAGFTVDSDTQITATVPDLTGQLDGQNGLVADVQVSAGISTSGDSSADEYTAVPLEVTGLESTSGPVAGGTDVTVDGQGFTGATDVTFKFADGSELSATPTVISDTQLSVTAPAAPGTELADNAAVVDVLVTVDDEGAVATSPVVAEDQFTYRGPQVDGLSALGGPLHGGTPLTITGTGFTGATAVIFDFGPGKHVRVKASAGSDSSVSVKTPAIPAADLVNDQAVAYVEVEVAAGDGTTAISPPVTAGQITQFTFQGPSVSSLSQNSGPLSGGTDTTVSGVGFTGAKAVLFHFGDGTTVSVPASGGSDTSITVTTPAVSANELTNGQAVADVEVKVAAGAGSTATSPANASDQFTFAGPQVTSVSPRSGTLQGGTTVTVSGSGFTGATGVLFHLANGDDMSVPASASSDTTLTVTSPAVSADQLSNDQVTADVEVQVPAAGGTTATSSTTPSDQFIYHGPTVTGLSVTKGPVQGGTKVTITGTNLTGASVVGFRAPNGTDVTVAPGTVTATSVTAFTPALPATLLTKNAVVTHVEVEVPTTDGSIAVSSDTTKGVFTFGGPTVSTVSPKTGLQGVVVTLTGKNLTGATTVKFTVAGVVYNATPSKVTAASLKVATPVPAAAALARGTAVARVQVAVPLPGSTTALSPNSVGAKFTYDGPTVTKVSPASGPLHGGTRVTVTGTHLTGVHKVLLSVGTTQVSAVPTSVTASTVTFATPALPATALVKGKAVVNIQVVLPTPSGASLTSATKAADRFSYFGPTVTLLKPTTGPSTGGTPVTATGANLTGATSVTLTVGSSPFSVPARATGPGTVTFTTPAIPPGDLHHGKAVAAVSVVVTGGGGTTAASPQNTATKFTYTG